MMELENAGMTKVIHQGHAHTVSPHTTLPAERDERPLKRPNGSFARRGWLLSICVAAIYGRIFGTDGKWRGPRSVKVKLKR